MDGVDAALWTRTEDGELHIVSKCGLYCDTCPAFQNGLCNGCPRLGLDDCVVRECAHRKEIATCHDCELDSCYHFEAYTARRKAMRRLTKALLAKERAAGGEVSAGGCGSGGGCGGGCGSGGAAGGCSGCSSSGTAACPAVRMLEALEEVAG